MLRAIKAIIYVYGCRNIGIIPKFTRVIFTKIFLKPALKFPLNVSID